MFYHIPTTVQDRAHRYMGLMATLAGHALFAWWLINTATPPAPLPVVQLMSVSLIPAPSQPVQEQIPQPAPPEPVAAIEPEPEPPKPELEAVEEKPKPVVKPKKAVQRQPVKETDIKPIESAPNIVQPVQVAKLEVPPPPAIEEPVIAPIFNADYLNNPAPEYPRQSQRLGEEGTVLLRVLVSVAGEAAEVQLSSTSGYSRLDKVAQEAVRNWRFVPAHQGSTKQEAWVIIPIVFNLEG
jgi:periplasmic protein TonB